MPLLTRHWTLAVILATSAVACGDSDENGGPMNMSVVPIDSTLNNYLQQASYENVLTPEPAIHDSDGPHGSGGVITYFTTELANSLRAGNTSHPIGSATVKELYASNGSTISGWAVSVKVANQGNANDWYWYEVLSATPGASPVADSVGASLCVNCHEDGRDYVLTPDPIPAP